MGTLTVGVLGGMGPEATLDFFAKLLAATPGKLDQDRLRIIIDNNPQVPNRNEAVAGVGRSPGPILAQMASNLERSGANFLVMPCNAAHAFKADIVSAVDVPFVDMIAATVQETLRTVPNASRVAVLAAAGCLDAGLYRSAFAVHGVEVIEPAGELRETFMRLLYRIKSGEQQDVVQEMVELAAALIDRGAQAVVAGCTEVPLVLSEDALQVPLINSTDVLVEVTAQYALRRLPLPATSVRDAQRTGHATEERK